MHFSPCVDTAVGRGWCKSLGELAGRQVQPSRACPLLRAADVEEQADAQEEPPQHGAQLGDQVELHDLTQVRVIGGGVCPELAGIQKHNISVHC